MADLNKHEKQPAAAEEKIDWAKVASEAQIMVDLNQEAMKAWHASKEDSGEDSEKTHD